MADQANEEMMKNCAHCKKAVLKVRRYYRNGRYYCSQNCWRAAKIKAAAQTEES